MRTTRIPHDANPTVAPLIVRICDLKEARSTYYFNASRGLRPPPIRIGPNSAAILLVEHELELAARIAGLSADARRDLIAELVALRPLLFERPTDYYERINGLRARYGHLASAKASRTTGGKR